MRTWSVVATDCLNEAYRRDESHVVVRVLMIAWQRMCARPGGISFGLNLVNHGHDVKLLRPGCDVKAPGAFGAWERVGSAMSQVSRGNGCLGVFPGESALRG